MVKEKASFELAVESSSVCEGGRDRSVLREREKTLGKMGKGMVLVSFDKLEINIRSGWFVPISCKSDLCYLNLR